MIINIMEDIDYIQNNYCKINIFNNKLMDYLLNKKLLMLDYEYNDITEVNMTINKEIYFKYNFQLLGYKWYSFFKAKGNVKNSINFYYPREYWKLYIFTKILEDTNKKKVFYILKNEIKEYL